IPLCGRGLQRDQPKNQGARCEGRSLGREIRWGESRRRVRVAPAPCLGICNRADLLRSGRRGDWGARSEAGETVSGQRWRLHTRPLKTQRSKNTRARRWQGVVVERQPVRRDARAEWTQDSDDADFELGCEGRAGWRRKQYRRIFAAWIGGRTVLRVQRL